MMRTARSSSRRGGVCLSACWDRHPPGCGPGDPPARSPSTSPWVWAWRLPLARSPSTSPLDVRLETPLPRSPSTSSLGVGLETPPQPDPPQLPPWVLAWKPARHAGIPPPPRDLQDMLGYHLQCMLGYPHPL